MLDLIRIQKELNITIHPDDVEVFTKLTNDFCYSIPIIIYDSYNDAIDVEITKIYNTDQSLIVKKECCDIDDEIYPNSYLFIAKDDYDGAIIYDSVSRKVFYGSGDLLLVNTL